MNVWWLKAHFSMLLLRSIFFTLLMPGTVTVLIPYWFATFRGRPASQANQVLRYVGFPPLVIGAVTLLWCIWRFYSDGDGTLAPIDPPKRLVVRGPYRYVRNPMYAAVLLILLGEAIYFLSWPILVEAVMFLAVTHLFVKYYEEPVLHRQFGESYEKYLQTVGRWIPRHWHRAT